MERDPIFFVIFQGGPDPLVPPPLDPCMKLNFLSGLIQTYIPPKNILHDKGYKEQNIRLDISCETSDDSRGISRYFFLNQERYFLLQP